MGLIKASIFSLLGCLGQICQAETITVFAASSLKAPLDVILQNAEFETRVSYASSAVLARQIQQGAPADVFMSANRAWVDWLRGEQDLEPPVVFAGNALVYAGDRKAAKQVVNVSDLRQDMLAHRVAVPTVGSVPLGIYTQQALASLRLWDHVGGTLVQTENASATANLLTIGAVERAFLYQSDVKDRPIITLHVFDEDQHDSIEYIAVAVTPAGRRIVDLLSDDDTQRVLTSFGFRSK